MAIRTSYVCPYCFTRHKMNDVEFRCMNKRCVLEDDMELTYYMQGDPNMPLQRNHTFKAPKAGFLGAMPQHANCPKCSSPMTQRVCPSCHNKLPDAIDVTEDMIISLVGARGSGKTHYVTVLIHELEKRIFNRFNKAAFAPLDIEARDRYKSEYYERVYKKHQLHDLTTTGLARKGGYTPLIYTLKFPSVLHNRSRLFTLVFFDTAGEDLDDADKMATLNRYICSSAGILFLLDPTQIPDVYHQLTPEQRTGSSKVDINSVTGAEDIINRVAEMVRREKHLSPSQKIDIPVAAAFSKFDVVRQLMPVGMQACEPSPHCQTGAFDRDDWMSVDAEIVSLLHEWESDNFISHLDRNYTKYSFFALSALGRVPQGNKIEAPLPIRIEDPFLWLLAENGVIPTTGSAKKPVR